MKKKYQIQKTIVFDAFHRNTSTMLMVSKETGIMRANVCRYVAIFRKEKKIHLVKKGICNESKISGVQYLTTNTNLFPDINIKQQNLFK